MKAERTEYFMLTMSPDDAKALHDLCALFTKNGLHQISPEKRAELDLVAAEVETAIRGLFNDGT